LKIFKEVFLALRRCVRVVLIARRGAGGIHPPQATMQKIVPKIRAPKWLNFFLEFSTEKEFVEKRFLNFYGDFWASVAPSVHTALSMFEVQGGGSV
jgi:hypothetical protein